MRELTSWNENRGMSPWRGLMDLQRNLDRVFDQTFGEGMLDEAFFRPACEIEETDSHYVMSFELPGISKNDVAVEIKDNQLIISGERKREREDKRKGGTISERTYGKFQRVIALPGDIDPENIDANFRDGVLELAVPKAESTKPVKVQIGEGKGSFFSRFLSGKDESKKPEAEKKQVNESRAA